MRKTFYEHFFVISFASVMSVLAFWLVGASLETVINLASYNIVIIALALMADDVVFKFLRYRRLLCFEYWVGFGFELACVCSFAYASLSKTVFQMILGLVLTALFGLGIYLWDAKVYNFIEFDENNLKIEEKRVDGKKDRRTLRKLSKEFPTMEVEKIKETLKAVLRYRFIADDITKDIDPNSPLCDIPVASYDELLSQGMTEKAGYLGEYIDDVLRFYTQKLEKENQLKEEQ